ncbi:phage neck terminator protein [Phocoenobacter skyensis]|uniref:Phage neck terminator protein gp12-like domain-containing protein n=1 Tax=Phocoenobacter skyensis TaxID=97481 RepID=A0A1H8A4U5_9PAST|nr:hypothetical protein [Pasteurella skyensis]QLB23322.1 hypothetical protein A6B44_08930 [Pasteurella skyensis]SEM65536.1 hypothetical protein SAMN05444853_1377 [Pasteurella skyensis]
MKKSLYKVLEAATSKPLFFAYQSGVKLPPKPYITIHILSADTSLPSHKQVLGENGERLIESHRQAIVQIDCYGNDSYQILDEFVQQLQTEEVLSICESLNVSISNFGGIQQMPETINSVDWESRSTLTIHFNYVTSVMETLHIIEKVEINQEYKNG